MKTRTIFRQLFICCITIVASIAAAAQDGDQTRSITSDDFTKARPAAAKPGTNGKHVTSTHKRVTYNLVRRDRAPIRWKSTGSSTRPRPKPTAKAVSSDIGVTVWKMRPPLASDTGVKLPVKVKNGQEWWSSARVDPLSPFKAGDRIRLGIESPTAGYLYVINSEVSSDGSFGDPSLIFPDPANQYNSVGPGMLVDIPDQKEDFPYFTLNPAKGNYDGELVAVIISPIKLNFQIGENKKILNIGAVIDIDIDIDVQIFASTTASGEVYTKAEADASCGSKTRDLVREKREATPCGTQSRNLTRDEPLPQTVYRVNTQPGRPAIAFIKLRATR